MTDAELAQAIQAIKNYLNEARDWDREEFDVMEHVAMYDELDDLELERDNRSARARYMNLPPLTYSLKEVLV